MKATYVQPALKIQNIDTEASMLATQSNENNFTPSEGPDSYQENIGESGTFQEVSGASALSKQGSFFGNPWDD